MAETGQELARVKAYWEKLSVPEKDIKRPTLAKVLLYKDVSSTDTQICGIFVIYNGQEYVYFAGQSVLNNDPPATNHIRAMKRLLTKLGLTEENAKFNFIVGFYLDCGELKKCSCVNIIFSSTVTRALGESTSGYLDKIISAIEKVDPALYKQLYK